jgi:hypothetical protein
MRLEGRIQIIKAAVLSISFLVRIVYIQCVRADYMALIHIPAILRRVVIVLVVPTYI